MYVVEVSDRTRFVGKADSIGAPSRVVRESSPGSPDGVLNPSRALFTEADYLLTEDPAITDPPS